MKKWAVHPKYVDRANGQRELYQNDEQLLVDREHRGIRGDVSVRCESLCGNINGAHSLFFLKIVSVCVCESTIGLNYLGTNHRGDAGKQHVMNVDSETRRRQFELVSRSTSSARLDTKHIITSCQRSSPLLKTKAAKLKRLSIGQQKHDQPKLFPTKQLGNNNNSILHPN